jgi:sulfur carrier protein
MVNGQARETSARTLAELCTALGYDDARIATAVNGDFVAAANRADTALASQDRVEIVAPRQGG